MSNILSDQEFTRQLQDLLRVVEDEDKGETRAVLSAINQKPIISLPEIGAATGTRGADHIFGLEANSDVVNNGGGQHTLIGDFGDDLLQGSSQNDTLHGGVTFAIAPDGSFTEGDLFYEDDGFDILQGGLGDDDLNEGSGNDILDGGGFAFTRGEEIEVDPLTGLPVNIQEVLKNDGTDRLNGGLGNDTFVFNTLSTGLDIIEDFEVRIDKIQLNPTEFGEDFSKLFFNKSTGILSFGSKDLAFLENFESLQGFDMTKDIRFGFSSSES